MAPGRDRAGLELRARRSQRSRSKANFGALPAPVLWKGPVTCDDAAGRLSCGRPSRADVEREVERPLRTGLPAPKVSGQQPAAVPARSWTAPSPPAAAAGSRRARRRATERRGRGGRRTLHGAPSARRVASPPCGARRLPCSRRCSRVLLAPAARARPGAAHRPLRARRAARRRAPSTSSTTTRGPSPTTTPRRR